MTKLDDVIKDSLERARRNGRCYSVVVFPEGGQWSAQLIERDLAAQGETMGEALAALATVIQASMHDGGGTIAHLSPAPSYYRDAIAEIQPDQEK